ncbi:MAG TPA: tetratricopeptide repeat protein [Casimicrobium sp.]|nr:tetratricopeptide repeat protein [Casimicrobium sp.]
MALSNEELLELAHAADAWPAATEAERATMRAAAAARGDVFLRAFDVMAQQLLAENTGVVSPTLADEARDAAMAGSPTTGRVEVHADEHVHEARAAGQLVGPYRLIREIGRGGMGVVWLAERADGQHTRQVALKMPLVEHLTWVLAARFARERNILASLEHPGIARLYDAGVDAETQPYIALEYVVGQPITDYVREERLRPEATVALFIRVLEAVAHAHAQLVIHRDIKPANILVDAKGEAHLLDFGIAKLLDDDSVDTAHATQLTRLAGRALTLAYASPEQINGASLGTASDIYSLGVVLYELLTGSSPYQPKGASRHDLESAILEQEPTHPSDKLLATSSQSGSTESSRTARRMRGDLDVIVLTALRKEPRHRYATAQAFAEDLRRYLNFEPIAAKPDSGWYRVGKFVRRNRVAVSVGALAAAATVVGVAGVLWQASVAREHAARAERVKDFIAAIFRDARPREGSGGVVRASDLLASASQRIESELGHDPAVAAELGLIVGEGFNNLGLPQESIAPLRAAIKRADQTLGDTHVTALGARVMLADALAPLELEEALRLLDDVVPKLLATLPASARRLVLALQTRSFVLAKRNDREGSVAAMKQAYDVAEKHLGPDHEDTIYTLGFLGNTYAHFDERAAALSTSTEALARAERVLGKGRPNVTLSSIERWHASALSASGKPDAAIPLLRRVLADQRALDAADTERVRHAMLQLARSLGAAGQVAEGLDLTRRTVALERAQNAVVTDDRRALVELLLTQLMRARRADEGLAMWRTETPALATLPPASQGPLANAVVLAHLHAFVGDSAGVKQQTEAARKLLAAGKPLPLSLTRAIAFDARVQGKVADAAALLAPEWNDAGRPRQQAIAQVLLGADYATSLLDLGEVTKAATVLSAVDEVARKGGIGPTILVSNWTLAQARLELNRTDAAQAAQAVSRLKPLVQAWREVNADSEWHGEALWWLGRAEQAAGNPAAANQHQETARALLAKSRLPGLRKLAAK